MWGRAARLEPSQGTGMKLPGANAPSGASNPAELLQLRRKRNERLRLMPRPLLFLPQKEKVCSRE